jgi:hypothetical protein
MKPLLERSDVAHYHFRGSVCHSWYLGMYSMSRGWRRILFHFPPSRIGVLRCLLEGQRSSFTLRDPVSLLAEWLGQERRTYIDFFSNLCMLLRVAATTTVSFVSYGIKGWLIIIMELWDCWEILWLVCHSSTLSTKRCLKGVHLGSTPRLVFSVPTLY